MNPYQRRQLLIERMETLESAGTSCKGCKGNCCTFEANSMMITPLEAVELMLYLRDHKLNSDNLKNKCVETINRYRLDQVLGTGKRSVIRRTYTCPFFGHMELGCPLPREIKPYGCLAFNSHHPEEKAGEHCYSELNLLSEREGQYDGELIKNELLIKKLGLKWEKAPIPLALLEIWEMDFTFFDLELC